jgi:hypothetical protein
VIRPVRDGDCDYVAAHMRQADRDEITASGVPDPLTALVFSVATSTLVWCATVDKRPACVFGVGTVSILGGIGSPWLLGTDDISRNPGAFIKHSRLYIRGMLDAYPHLTNHVDARNTRAVRWLRRAGFTVGEPEPHGPFALPFHPFEMRA